MHATKHSTTLPVINKAAGMLVLVLGKMLPHDSDVHLVPECSPQIRPDIRSLIKSGTVSSFP